jgi:enterochelin esterase-like enzyme
MKRVLTPVTLLLWSLAPLIACPLVLAWGATILAQPTEPKIDSPRVAALWQELKIGNATALANFWLEIKGKAPLIEPIPGVERHVWVTFIRREGATAKSVTLQGGLPLIPRDKQLTRLGDTDLWYRTERIPTDARFAYVFYVTFARQDGTEGVIEYLDPLNARKDVAGSVVEMPGAPPQPWVKRLAGVPAGKQASQTVKSVILNQQRKVTVYTPPGYDPTGNLYGLLVLFDGQWYQAPEYISTRVILDNLITKQQIEPLVAVFVDNTARRSRELSCSDPFTDFVSKELIPWIRQNFHVSTDPERVIVGGLSQGGLAAAYCGFRHPEIFGNILSQAGSFWYYPAWFSIFPPTYEIETGWLTRRFATGPKLALRFYLDVGRFDPPDFRLDQTYENRHFRDVLQAKGYPVTYQEYNGGHDFLSWRGTLADGLIALAGPAKSP